MPPRTEAPDRRVRGAPQGDMSDITHTVTEPCVTRWHPGVCVVCKAHPRTAMAQSSVRVEFGLSAVCATSDTSPCGAIRTGPSEASEYGEYRVAGRQGVLRTAWWDDAVW